MVLSSCVIDGQRIERCPLVVSNIKQGVRGILIGQYSKSATILVFSIKIIKSLPTGPMATLTQTTKLVPSLYIIWIGRYDVLGFLGHGILIFAFSIFFTQRWCAKCHFECKYFLFNLPGKPIYALVDCINHVMINRFMYPF